MINCKIEKWRHLEDIEWEDIFIDEMGKIWHDGREVRQHSHTTYFSKDQYVDVRPYVKLPTQRGKTDIPVHILQMQSNFGYQRGMDVCHLNRRQV